MSNDTRIVLIVLGLVVIGLIWLPIANPLRRTEPQIEAWLLRLAPPGTSHSQVLELIESRKWEIEASWYVKTLVDRDPDYPGVEGTQVVHIDLGGYRGFPWHVDVDCFWGFDDDEKLIDVNVRRMADSL